MHWSNLLSNSTNVPNMTLICQTLKIVFKHEAKLLHYETYVREQSHTLKSTTALLTTQACENVQKPL